MIFAVIQYVGVTLILAAFAANAVWRLPTKSFRYLLLNFTGADFLTASALHTRQWGFVGLESAWALVAAVGMAWRLLDRGEGRARG
ncbi:MAG: hypothetical protein P8174_10950 [Gemmatimonadota bacterium]